MQRRPHGKKGGCYFSDATREHVRKRAKEYKKEDYTKKGFVKILRDELALYHKGDPKLYSGVPSFETVRGWLKEDLKKLRKARSSAGRGYDEPDTLLHTVQIDHCLLNIDLLDDEGNVVGRPWLTLAIDVASRVIIGFYLSLRDPSAVSISGVLSMCVLPKHSKGEFWPYGIMLFLHADNGPDLRSNALELGCQHWNIDLDWRPTETPEYGAHIESLVGKVKQWVRDLPGGCTFDEKNRKRSLSKPAWTIQRLRSWLTDRIQNSYHTTSHSGIGNLTPLQAYETLLVGTDERPGLGQVKQVPAGREEEFRISFLPAYNPTLNEEGVVINYLHYNANELQTMLKRIGSGNKRWVRRDHNDISVAYIWNSETKTYITARSRRTKPLSTKTWEKAKDLVDEEGIDKNEDTILAKVEQLEQAEENTQKTDKTRQELREQAHEQDVTPPPQPTPVDLSNVQAAGSELDWDDSWDSDG